MHPGPEYTYVTQLDGEVETLQRRVMLIHDINITNTQSFL